MKFVSLGTKRSHRRGELNKPAGALLECFSKPMTAPHQIHSYAELQQQIHDDLRIQHPEWVQPNGECPTCDSYEARLMELLDTFTRTGSNESVAVLLAPSTVRAGNFRLIKPRKGDFPSQ